MERARDRCGRSYIGISVEKKLGRSEMIRERVTDPGGNCHRSFRGAGYVTRMERASDSIVPGRVCLRDTTNGCRKSDPGDDSPSLLP